MKKNESKIKCYMQTESANAHNFKKNACKMSVDAGFDEKIICSKSNIVVKSKHAKENVILKVL